MALFRVFITRRVKLVIAMNIVSHRDYAVLWGVEYDEGGII